MAWRVQINAYNETLYSEKWEAPLQGSGRRRKIIVINYYPLEFFGGGEILSIHLFNYLERYYDVEYLAPDHFNGPLRVDAGQLRDTVRFKYSRIHFEDNFIPLSDFVLRPTPPAKYTERADLIMVFLDRPPSKRFLVNMMKGGKTVLFLLHGLTFERPSFRSVWNSIIAAYQVWIRLYLRVNRSLLTHGGFFYQLLNDSQLQYMSALGVQGSHTFLMPNSVDFSAYHVSRNDDKFRVIYLGRLDRLVKGASLIPKVANGLAARHHSGQIEFIVAGSGQAEQLIAELDGENETVTALGQVTDQVTKANLLSGCNLMVSFSNTEAFSISLLEGLASGLPILSTNVSGPAYIVSKDSSFGRVLGFNAKEFVDAIEEYYEKWSADRGSYYLEKVGRRKRAEAAFGREADIGESYRKAINAILNMRGPSDINAH